MKQFILSCMLAVILVGCDTPSHSTTRIDNIESIWFHEHGRYSFSTINESTGQLINYTPYGPYCESEVYYSLPPDSKPYAVISDDKSSWGDISRSVYIKVPANYKGLQGAGWNHGKFGSGQTSKIGD